MPLSAEHRREILIESSVAEAVAAERGYTTVGRPNASMRDEYGRDTRDQLKALGFPSWAVREDYYFPGLHIPQYTPSGQRYAGQFKPFRAVPGRDGKPQRYASAKGQARLDVHPRWSVLTDAVVPPIVDPAIPLWITEGVKKADALTSRGVVTVALAGVYSWRNTHAALGDWEDVALKGREITICFDADAVTKPAVAQAMARLGKWLRHKGASRVWYLTVPPMANGNGCKGVDDFFAAGGTLDELERARERRPPEITDTEDRFTDARLAETLADEVLDGSYIWVPELGWLRSDGTVWREVHEAVAAESVRQWTLERFQEAVAKLKVNDNGAGVEADGWRTTLSKSKAQAILERARGIVITDALALDADADHLNTASGYLNLTTGEVRQLGGDEYPTRITGGRFDPAAQSDIWDRFLARVLPDAEVRAFVQRLIGYAMLGEVREHKLPLFTGTGRNGKGTLRDAVLAAFGTYALEVDPAILMVAQHEAHKTFLMELKGRRLVFCSETEKHKRFAEATAKRLSGGDPIQANRMRKDPITFQPTHLLIMCTNHLPEVSADDPALWERLLVVPFDVFIPPEERDPRLPARLKEPDVQAAVLAWAYRGYQQYIQIGLAAPEAVTVRTAAYRTASDGVGRFLDERVGVALGERVSLAVMHAAYLAWFRGEARRDESPVSKRELSADLARRGMQIKKSDGIMIVKNVALTASDQD